MISDPGVVLHPEAAVDIIEIWEYVASDSPKAARRVREDIMNALRNNFRQTSCAASNFRTFVNWLAWPGSNSQIPHTLWSAIRTAFGFVRRLGQALGTG